MFKTWIQDPICKDAIEIKIEEICMPIINYAISNNYFVINDKWKVTVYETNCISLKVDAGKISLKIVAYNSSNIKIFNSKNMFELVNTHLELWSFLLSFGQIVFN